MSRSEAHLLALVLARSLDAEVPNARRACLNDVSSSVLANEVRYRALDTARAFHNYLYIFPLSIDRRNCNAARKCLGRSQCS